VTLPISAHIAYQFQKQLHPLSRFIMICQKSLTKFKTFRHFLANRVIQRSSQFSYFSTTGGSFDRGTRAQR